MKPDKWLTFQEATGLLNALRRREWQLLANEAGEDAVKPFRWTSVATVRRRLKFMDRESRRRGASGLLKRFGPRTMMVSAEALLRELRTDPNLQESRTSALESQIADHEQKLRALRNSLRSMNRALRELSSGRPVPTR